MRILIAGGTGLIGRALIRTLLSNGHSVIVLSRSGGIPQGNVEYMKWDARTTTGWGGVLDRCEAVINLAGENISRFPWSRKNKKLFRSSRLDAGSALVHGIKGCNRKPQVFIQSSAVGFYGPRGDEPIDESGGSGDDFSAELCRDWEASTLEVEALGVRRIVVRTGIALSKAGGIYPKLSLPARLLVGGRIGSGRQGIPWIHMDDETGAIHFLLENESAQGVFNLSAPFPVSNSVFLRTVSTTLKRPYWFHVPAILIRGMLGEMSSLLLEGQFMIPERLLRLGYQFKYEKLESALKDIEKT